jgi:hypothetical protein
MNAVNGTMLCLAAAMGALACAAQDATIPFRQIERDAQLSAELATRRGDGSVSHSNGFFLGRHLRWALCSCHPRTRLPEP